MISSVSCKKEVCNSVCVCVCVTLLSDIRQSTIYLSFTHMGGVFVHFGRWLLYGCTAPRCSQAVTWRDTPYQCLGMDWFTFLCCCLSTGPAGTSNPYTHSTNTDSAPLRGLRPGWHTHTSSEREHWVSANPTIPCGKWRTIYCAILICACIGCTKAQRLISDVCSPLNTRQTC